MKVLVIHGGSSTERELSLREGMAVGQALVAAGHQVTYFDPGDDTTFMLMRNFVLDAEVVFPVLRGRGGEDGAVQTVLESLQTPYVGSTSMASQHCYDKVFMLKTLHQAGILTPVSDLVTFEQLAQHPIAKQPFVFKPRFEGDGSDTYLIRDLKSFDAPAYKPAFEKHGSMLLQSIIDGIEFSVGILGDQPMTPVEIAISGDGIVQQLCPPGRLSLELQHEAQALAYQVYTLMGCRHMANIDMMWAADGNVYVIEIDALPELNTGDPYVTAAAAAGLSMPALVDRLVRMTA